MRLTGKNGNKYGFITENNTLGVFDDGSIADKCYTKLGQLEDIEEELGIDLVTLFKALKAEEFYIKTRKYGIVKKAFQLKDFRPDVSYDGEWVLTCTCQSLFIEDYGKTWALTKEELE